MANYDIFISYRNTDDNGNPTRDAKMAESLYYALRNKGYNPFFSKYSIDAAGRSDYITAINNAIESAKVFVVVGTSKKNLTSRWVKRETNMFISLMMRAEEGALTLLSYRSEDFPVDELPADLAYLQSYPDEAAIVRFVDTCLKEASGFRNGGCNTELLYDENQTTPLGVDNGNWDTPAPCFHKDVSSGFKPGDKLNNRYNILKMVGKGGMSYVYLAIDERTNRQCAIKAMCRNDTMNFSIVLSGMHTEIDLLKTLDNPAIPHIFDIIETQDMYCVVMEYIQGLSMQKILVEQGAQNESLVLDVARQLGEVLQYLHTQPHPIIYRDIKPANIMLQPDGRVKLIDYGTARVHKHGALNDTTCLGTMGYAAPEQFGGMGQTDARTDIYCLGVTLYHLVTGRNPSDPPYEILPIRQVNPSLSRGLEYIIQKCTQKDPKERFQTDKEFLDALAHIDKLGKRALLFSLFGGKKDRILKKRWPEKHRSRSFTPQSSLQHAPRSTGNAPIPTQNSYPVPITKPVAKPRSQTSPEIEAIANKLATLDPESIRIIRDMVDRLAKK